MAQIEEGVFRTYRDGTQERMTAADYNRDREIIRQAINDVDRKVSLVQSDRLEALVPEIEASRGEDGSLLIRLNRIDAELVEHGDEINETVAQLAENSIHLSSFPIQIPEANDTARIQRALDYAAQNKRHVYGSPDETYIISSIRIKNGVKSFICKGTIKGSGTSANGVIQLDGPYKFAGAAVRDCIVSVDLDMSAGDTQGIYADGSEDCFIINNRIYGFTDDANKKYGILLGQGCQGNTISGNRVIGTLKPTGAYQFMIIGIGNSIAWGGYFDGTGGTTVRATNPVRKNLIFDNQCLNGTHGIVLNAGEYNRVSDNTCENNSHRAVVLEPVCLHNIVYDNELLAYGSSAVILAYGSDHNIISNNQCIDNTSIFPADAESSINCYVGCKNNKFIGNKIVAKRNHGIYLAVNAQNNEVENNTIEGYRLAGVAIESDWIPVGSDYMVRSALPVDAKYSRPNYAAPPLNSEGVQATQWAYGNTEGNIVQNNNVGVGSGTTGAEIYLAQIGANAMLKDNIIKANNGKAVPTNHHYLYVYEETVDKLVNNKLRNNDFLGGTAITIAKFWMSRWRKHFDRQDGNEFLDTKRVTFDNGDTTPSVRYGGEFWFANSAATSVTNFDDGVDGQEIVVRLDANTSLIYSSASLRLKGNVNVTGANANMFMRFKNLTGIWFEMYRNF